MSYEHIFPFKYPIKTARSKCEERYIGFKFLSKIPSLIFPSKDTYTLCYAYFRWFDDITDSHDFSKEEIMFTVQRQKRFLSQLYSQEISEELSTEELFLAHLVAYDKRSKNSFKNDLEILISTLEFDANRKYKILSSNEIDKYIDDNTKSYVNISLAIFNQDCINREEFYKIARASFIIDLIYDLKKDFEIGYINIPREDINSYNIDLNDLNSPEIKNWVKDKTFSQIKIVEDKKSISSLSLIPKLIANSMLLKRKIKLNKILKNIT